jgi:hypothetical protein
MGDESADMARVDMPVFGPVASSGAISGELLMTHRAVSLGRRPPVTMADLAVRARYTATTQETDPTISRGMLAAGTALHRVAEAHIRAILHVVRAPCDKPPST